LGHHQWKTPLAVRPVFLKSPRRVEALVYLERFPGGLRTAVGSESVQQALDLFAGAIQG
jgi:hypothetical protein